MREVLLVDGHEDTRHVLSAVLTHTGYSVRQAEDGVAAMEAIRGALPDLVAMEHPAYLPGGAHLLGLLRSASRSRPVRVLVVTSRSFGADEGWVGRGEGDRLLVKPVVPSRFLEIVREMIGYPDGGEAAPSPPADVPGA